MGDPMMSATFQQQYTNNIQTSMDFPHNFLEPSISSAAPIAQTKTNTFFSPNTVYSSNNSSLSSSRQRLACDDSGITSSGSLANEQDNSSMHFLSSALATTVNDCIGSPNQMNFGTNDLLEDFEPVARDRCNTWPMRHPTTEFQTNNSPLMHERIAEEESRNGSQVSVHLAQDRFMNSQNQLNQINNVAYQQMPVNDNQEQELNYDSPHTYSDGNSHESGDEDEFQGTVQKRSQTRRNAWGNMSYADLITQAILSSPDQRLTLSQIYEWMVEHVAYFSDKGDANSSAGWKVEMDERSNDGFEGMRSRCNTWPLKRFLTNDETSQPPEPFQIQYEDSNHSVHSINPIGPTTFPQNWTTNNPNFQIISTPTSSFQSQIHQPQAHQVIPSTSTNLYESAVPFEDRNEEEDQASELTQFCRQNVDSSSGQRKMNPWGDQSYADLITKALETAPNNRLKLNEIYQWFIDNVKYFNERADPNLSSGWKNSIRHNLSLHSRFMRIQNEGAGKSSWWVINPDAKTGRNPRRRATMDASTKSAIDKKRRGARKRVEMQGSIQGSMNSLVSANRKASQPDFYNNRTKEEDIDSDYDSSFRSRTFSNVSCHGRNQISPNFTPNDDFNYPPWASNNLQPGEINSPTFANQSNNTINELMDRTDQICLANDDEYSQLGCPISQPQQLNVYNVQQQQIKHEEMKPQFQQTSYQELKAVRGIDQQSQNPLLNQFQKPQMIQQVVSNQQQTRSGNYPFGCNGVANQQHWQGNNNQACFQQQSSYQQKPQMTQQLVSPTLISQPRVQMVQQFNNQMLPQSTLPKDLENLNTFVTQDCNVQGIDEIIRQELSTSNNLNFDF